MLSLSQQLSLAIPAASAGRATGDEHFVAVVHVTQIVKHGSTDATFSYALQLQMPFRIEPVNGLDEADSADGHEVIEFDLRAGGVPKGADSIAKSLQTYTETCAQCCAVFTFGENNERCLFPYFVG